MEDTKVGDYKKLLNQYVGAKRKIRIDRDLLNGERINGFVHDMSEQLLVVQQFHDFYCEGYSIIRLSDVSTIRSNEYERFFERVIQREGWFDKIKYDRAIPISDITASLSYFNKRNENIILECESYEAPEDDAYLIGRVLGVKDNAVSFLSFNALGQWDKVEVPIKIVNITRIQFDTPYINIMSNHLQV